MYKNHTVSVVLPCYNEEEGVRAVLSDMPSVVDEVIVVDNNSTDRTAEVARSLGARVIEEKRQGYGAAYKAGFRAATGDIIVTMDGDGTYPRNFIPVLLDVMFAEDIDFITCDRTGHKIGQKGFTLRVLGNSILNFFLALLFFVRLRDSQSGMWVFRREILSLLTLTSDGMPFSEEIKVEAFTHPQVRAEELPIYYVSRVGDSKLNMWRDGFNNLFFLFKKRWERWFHDRRPILFPEEAGHSQEHVQGSGGQ
ncbi:MAG: glycosyltransferase family 2 protein [Chloroflexi bacterium]|nr:glycosyltransferase family 2 protein [Chloroflexota bacterium]